MEMLVQRIRAVAVAVQVLVTLQTGKILRAVLVAPALSS
jgi:hypothetical protein